MDIKVLRTIQVGHSTNVVNAGEIVRNVDDAEAKALIAANFAVEVTGKEKAKVDDKFDLTKLLANGVDEVVAQLENLTAEQLVELRDAEAAGKKRKGILDAIAEFDLD